MPGQTKIVLASKEPAIETFRKMAVQVRIAKFP
jgi:hypothetical protein